MSKLLDLAHAYPRLSKLLNYARANSKEAVRFLKFAIVGTIGAVVDYSFLNLLIQVFGFSKFWANTCSFSAAVLSNFTWNRLWTFPESRERSLALQLTQFAVVSAAGLAINQAIFLSLDAYVLGEAGLLATPVAALAFALGLAHNILSYNLAKAVAIIVVLFWNFGFNRLWTYRGID